MVLASVVPPAYRISGLDHVQQVSVGSIGISSRYLWYVYRAQMVSGLHPTVSGAATGTFNRYPQTVFVVHPAVSDMHPPGKVSDMHPPGKVSDMHPPGKVSDMPLPPGTGYVTARDDLSLQDTADNCKVPPVTTFAHRYIGVVEGVASLRRRN
jgi:hypothetical protein